MNVKRLVLATLLIVAVLVAACAPAATPVLPTATVAPKPTEAPKPTAASAFDMKAALDKYLSGLPDGFGTVAPAALKDQMKKATALDKAIKKNLSKVGYRI